MKLPRVRMPRHWRNRIYKLNKNSRVNRYKLPAATAALAIIVIVGTVFAFNGKSSQTNGGHAGHDAAKDYYQSQVDTETGEPISGRDPANQSQGSLASAASNPTGAGQRIENPASGVNGGNYNNPAPGNDPNTGLNSSGCYYNYGDPGQCLPAHVKINGTVTCDAVRTHGGFGEGIKVTGTNHLNLADNDHDSIVCETGEN